MTEQEAIRRIQQGDISGLRILVHCHQVQAVRAATLITHDTALAEEVVQSAFLRFYDRAQQFDAGRPFAPYFLRMVVNAAIKASKKQQRTLSIDGPGGKDAVALYDWLVARTLGPEEMVVRSEQRDAVWQALGQLSPRQRAAVVQRYYLEMSEAEMAEQMEVAPGTVKWHLHQARERLRTLLVSLRDSEIER